MRAVNLLPREEHRPRAQGLRTPLLVLAGGLAAVTASVGVLAHSASTTSESRRAELAAVEAAIDRLPPAPKPAVTQGALAQERASRVAALTAALGTRVPFDRLMRELSLVLPEDSWLIGISASAPSGAAAEDSSGSGSTSTSAEGQGEVTIQGATYSHDAVARVLARLAVVPSLRNVRLGSSAIVEVQSGRLESRTGRGVRTVVTFTVLASVATRGSA